MKCYKIHDRGSNAGSQARYQIELYHFHPEEGPPGTFGRGPYCIGKHSIPVHNIDHAKANLAALGAVDLDTAVAEANAS